MGKALDGQAGALKRNGVSIDEALFATDRYTAVQQALSDQVGGFAEAEGKTFAGSLERMKNELGDLAEGVGGGAVDAFTTLFGVVENLTGALESVSPEAQNTIGKVATFGAVGLVAAGGLSTLIGQVIKARENFALAAEGVLAMRGALLTLGQIGLVVGSLVALREVIGTIDDEVDSVDVSKLENQLLDLAESGEVSGSTLERVFEGLGKPGLLGGGIEQTRQLKSDIDQLDEALAKLSARDPGAAAAAFERISEALREQGATTGQIKDRFNDYNATLTEADTANRTTGAAITEATEAVDGQAQATQDATSALKDYTDALHAQFDPLFGAVSATRALSDANSDVTAKEMELAAAVRDHGEGSLEATAAQEELNRAYDDASEAALDQEAALLALVDMVRQQPGAIDAAKAKLQQWVDQGKITQASADATRAQIDAMNAEAESTPASIMISASSTGTTAVAADFANLKARIDAVPREINILTRLTTIVAGSTNIPLRAEGGPVLAGHAYVVGEKRPELFVPSENGTILPAVPGSGSGGGWGGGGGSTMVEETIIVRIGEDEIARAVRRSDRRSGR